MPETIDSTMRRASEALARMDYLDCEDLCLDALGAAREQGNWADYARVLMPLQECRRQRRMIACDAGVFRDKADVPEGVVVLTPPHAPTDATRVDRDAREKRIHVEVLWVSQVSAHGWTIASFRAAAPHVKVTVARPPDPIDDAWYLLASEALGDAAIAQVTAALGSVERIVELEKRLDVVTDHEKLHQRLGDAARAVLH